MQREYITRHVKVVDVARTRTENSKRQKTKQYYFTRNGCKTTVCQNFFIKTLGISEKQVRTSVNKLNSSGFVELDKRGGRLSQSSIERHQKQNKLVNDHINKFPRVESHYCRSSSSKEYLHNDLSLSKMYDMFSHEYTFEDKPSFSLYKKVFNTKNLSFHKPKKDQCPLCTTYHQGDEKEKLDLKDRYAKHTAEKEKVRLIKQACKEKAIEEPLKYLCASFDLQQVIYLPKSNDSQIFYKRRLSNYNLTFYNIGNTDCHCYVWHEGQSKRGSSEISTCVYNALNFYDTKGIETVYLFSDGCAGQNKNSIMPTMLLYLINNSLNLKDITLRFFETSHGQNEGDSVHSTISTALKGSGDVFIPAQLEPIFRLARRKRPYIVKPLQFSDFFNFKSMSTDLKLLNQRDTDHEQINWTQIMEFRVMKAEPETIFFKTSHSQSSYRSITLKTRQQKQYLKLQKVSKLNDTICEISREKFKDLQVLCHSDTPVVKIAEHKAFYDSLLSK